MFKKFQLTKKFQGFIAKYPNYIYFNSAATTLKPDVVINSFSQSYYQFPFTSNSIDNRLSAAAIYQIKKIRQHIANFIDCQSQEVVFFPSTTFSINQIAAGYADNLQPGDEIILSNLEHNANLLPWLALKQSHKIKLKFLEFNFKNPDNYLQQLLQLLTKRTKIISLAMIDNTISYSLPFTQMIKMIKKFNSDIKIFADATQWVGKKPLSFSQLEIDFLCFSAHKVFGPFGLGIGVGKSRFLEQLIPLLKGSNSVVGIHKRSQIEYNIVPQRFEGGTFDLPTLIAFDNAISFLEKFNLAKISEHITTMYQYLMKKLIQIPHLKTFQHSQSGSSVIFNLINLNSHDVATYLADNEKIVLRSGNHCAFLTDHIFGTKQTLRVSLHFYNDFSDIDHLCKILNKISHEPEIVMQNYHQKLQILLFKNGKISYFPIPVKFLNLSAEIKNQSCADYFQVYIQQLKPHVKITFNGQACLIAFTTANLLVKIINEKPTAEALKILKAYLAFFQTNQPLLPQLKIFNPFAQLWYQPHRLNCALFFAQYLIKQIQYENF